MAFLNTILAAIGGFLAGFVGHVTAHDFCAAVPKWSQKLILLAVRRLEPRDRARYHEEWLADLEERPTVIAKLKHAIGCMRCARKMRQQSGSLSRLHVRLEFVGSGHIELDGRSALLVLHLLNGIRRTVLVADKMPRIAHRPIKFVGTNLLMLRCYREARSVDLRAVRRSMQMACSKETTAIRAYIDGELVVRM